MWTEGKTGTGKTRFVARHAQMLLGGGGPPKPSVIRNVDEQLRAACGKPAHLARIGRFITNKSTERIPAWKLPHNVLISFVETAHLAGHARDHAMDQWKWLVLAERDEMDFVVYEFALALRVKKQRAVVRHKTA